MKIKVSNDLKIFIFLSIILSLLSIPGPIIKHFQTSIQLILFQSVNDPSNFENSVLNNWAVSAYSIQSPLFYGFLFIASTALLVAFMVFYNKGLLKYALMGSLVLYISYFVFFTFVIYPQLETILTFQDNMGGGLSFIAKIWMSTVSYLGESPLFVYFTASWEVFFVFFWILANQTVTTKQSRWLYPSLIFPYIAGKGLGTFFIHTFFDFHASNMENSSGFLILTILLIFITIGVYLSLNRLEHIENSAEIDQEKKGLFSFEFRLKYLLTIFAILLCYSVCTTYLKDISNLLYLYKNNTYDTLSHSTNNYYYKVVAEFIFILFTFSLIRKIGWFVCAIAVPLFFIFPIGFYLGVIPNNMLSPDLAYWSDILISGIIAGSYWTLFLSTKEMTYIPLPLKTKARGKMLIESLQPYILIQKMIVSSPYSNELGTGMKWGTYGQIITVFLIWTLWIFSVFKLKKYYYHAIEK